MDWADTSSTALPKHTPRVLEKEEKSKLNVIYKAVKPVGTKRVKPDPLWLMESKKGARKSWYSTQTSVKTGNLKRQIGWCISITSDNMKKNARVSSWCQKYFTKLNQGNVIGLKRLIITIFYQMWYILKDRIMRWTEERVGVEVGVVHLLKK